MVKVHTQDHITTLSEVVRIPTPTCQATVCVLSTIFLENVTKTIESQRKGLSNTSLLTI